MKHLVDCKIRISGYEHVFPFAAWPISRWEMTLFNRVSKVFNRFKQYSAGFIFIQRI